MHPRGAFHFPNIEEILNKNTRLLKGNTLIVQKMCVNFENNDKHVDGNGVLTGFAKIQGCLPQLFGTKPHTLYIVL